MIYFDSLCAFVHPEFIQKKVQPLCKHVTETTHFSPYINKHLNSPLYGTHIPSNKKYGTLPPIALQWIKAQERKVFTSKQ